MKSENILGYVIILLIIIIMIKSYYDNDYFHLKCIVSDVNGKNYCVRERAKIQEASDSRNTQSIHIKNDPSSLLISVTVGRFIGR